MQSLARLGAIAALMSIAASSGAQTGAPPGSTDVSSEGTYVAAKPISQPPPVHPNAASARNREGWVALGFIVSTAGDVRDPLIEVSSGNDELDNAALAAVRLWRYEPATLDGRAVEHSVSRAIVPFRIAGSELRVTDALERQFTRIQLLLVLSKLDDAARLLRNVEERARFFNLYENARFEWLQYSYFEELGSGDRRAMQDALTRAIGYDEDYLPPDILVGAIQRLFVLQARGSDFGAALETFERLQASSTARTAPGYEEAVATLEPSVREIRRVIAGPTVLRFDARMPTYGDWHHRLLRRAFSLANVQGTIFGMSVRCERRNARFDAISPGLTWEIPESWGACVVYVQGDPGTSFSIDELPGDGASSVEPAEEAPLTSSAGEPESSAGRDSELVPVLRIPPRYPSVPLRRGECGWVRIESSIDETGRIENARAVESSSAAFVDEALTAFRQWRYRPQMEDGKIVRRDGMQTTIVFELEGGTDPTCNRPRPSQRAVDGSGPPSESPAAN